MHAVDGVFFEVELLSFKIRLYIPIYIEIYSQALQNYLYYTTVLLANIETLFLSIYHFSICLLRDTKSLALFQAVDKTKVGKDRKEFLLYLIN